jgi:hypothetical protein
MAYLLTPFVYLALIGLLFSLVAHVCGLLGLPQPLGYITWGLHIGVFVVWIPAIVAAQNTTHDINQRDAQEAAMRGCPVWFRRLTSVFFVYALFNFATFMAMMVLGGQRDEASQTALAFRGFSGHWMVFYSAAAAMLESAVTLGNHDSAQSCPGQRPVSPAGSVGERGGAPAGTPGEAGAPEGPA